MLNKLLALNGLPPAPARPKETPTVAALVQKPKKRSLKERLAHGAVEWSEDLERIENLPRRQKPELEAIAMYLTAILKRPEGKQDLRPIQAWALWEFPRVGGGLGSVGVGEGKELIGLLMPMVFPNCQRAVLFIPPALRAQMFERDWPEYNKHWNLPNLGGGAKFTPGKPVLTIVAYSELSDTKATQLLEQLQPDLVLANEIHNLRNRDAARTKRFLRYFADHPEARLCGWSGTLTGTSVTDYTHFSAIALGEGSPVPLSISAAEEWASALDPDSNVFIDPGELRRFCEGDEDIRDGFSRRLMETPGFIHSGASTLGTTITFYERTAPALPQKIFDAFATLRKNPKSGGWKRPDGEELVNAMQVNECARQLAVGFYYYWRFPRGEPKALIDQWFQARQDWNRELREELRQGRPYLDSPALCENAAKRFYAGGCPTCDRQEMDEHERSCKSAVDHPLWASVMYRDWMDIKNQVHHIQAVEWIDDYLLLDIAEWMQTPGIVWTEHTAAGHRLSQLTGFPYYGGGDKANSDILKEVGNRSIIASLDAHDEGKNLQKAFYRNLVVTWPADAKLVEQTLGRTHRHGQPKDEVEVHLYRHTPEISDALVKSISRARYIQQTLKTPQKLVYGNWAFRV